MKNIIFIILGVLIAFPIFSQSSQNLIEEPTFFDMKSASQNALIVRKLDLSKNSLDSLPKSILQLQNLELLVLSNNNLSTLPEWFSEMKQLKYLYLDNNNYKEIPNVLYKMNLIELHISSNQITNVSFELKKIVTLKKLDIAVNSINYRKISRIKQTLKYCMIIN